MSTKYLETLLLDCKEALLELDATKAHQAYLKVTAQLENKCGTCGDLMDSHNCCVMDIKDMKMYHIGCAPQKKVEPEPVKRTVSTDEKLDAILSLLWQHKGKR